MVMKPAREVGRPRPCERVKDRPRQGHGGTHLEAEPTRL